MLLHPVLRKATELGIGLTAIATLILAGCGGGSSSAGGGSSVASTTTTVTPYKGRFSSGTVSLKDASGSSITLTGGGTINASGVASVSFPSNVSYPLTVNVSGTYEDETTGASGVIQPGSPLQGLIPAASDAAAASGVPVTAVTHFARGMLPASGFSSASAVAAISGAASSVLGVSYNQAMLPPVFNSSGQTSDPTTLKLTALAHVIGQQGAGADLGASLNNVAAQLVAGSAVGLVLPQGNLNAALGMVNGGASSVVPAGTVGGIPQFAPPNASLGNQIQVGLPVCATGQVLQYSPTGLQCVGSGGGSSGGTMTVGYYTGTIMPGQQIMFVVSGLTSTTASSYLVNFGGNVSIAPSIVYVGSAGTGSLYVTVPNDAKSGTLTITDLGTNKVATLTNVTVAPKPVVQPTCTGGGTTTPLPASGVDATNWSNCSNQSPGDVNVVWGGSEFVAGTKSSTDGYVWTTNGNPQANKNVAFNGTRWVSIVANSMGNQSSYSADASSLSAWTTQTLTLSSPGVLLDIFAVNGRFFITNNYGKFLTSTDGINWTETAWPCNQNATGITRVLWHNSKYLIYVGNANYQQQYACTSSDGITWSGTQITGMSMIPNAYAFDGTKFVALSTSQGLSSIDVMSSADGVAWVKSGTQVPLKRGKDLIWTGSQFIALGSVNQNTNIYDGIAMSSDGLNWTQYSSSVGTNFNSLRNLAYAPTLNRVISTGNVTNNGYTTGLNSLFVLHQVPAATPPGAVAAPSGVTANLNGAAIVVAWSAVPNASGYNVYRSTTPNQPLASMTKLVSSQAATTYTDSFGLAGSTTYYYKIEAILDAVTNSPASAEVAATIPMGFGYLLNVVSGVHFTDVTWTGTQYVGVGGELNTYTSPDGKIWTLRQYQSGGVNPLNAVASSGSSIVSVSKLGWIFTSTDGIAWASQSNVTANTLANVIYAGGQYIAVGAAGTILTSPDGTTWTTRTSGTTAYLSAIAWSGSMYVASATGSGTGVILTSPDGINWTPQNVMVNGVDGWGLPYTYSLGFSVATYGNGKFVGIGGGVIYTSTDGISWVSTTHQTNAVYDITWSGSMFAAVGINGTVETSTDGINWTVRSSKTGQELKGVASDGNIFVVVGYGNTIMNSSQIMP